MLFGAGHVGKALVRMLGELPCRITWVDSRAEQFPRDPPPNVTIECAETPQYAVDRAPARAAFLVMTHSHALDLTLCERILRRNDFAYFGLIGSATKRAKFTRRFKARGLSDDVIERMVCPIGIPELSGKHPGEIARGRGPLMCAPERPGDARSAARGGVVTDEHFLRRATRSPSGARRAPSGGRCRTFEGCNLCHRPHPRDPRSAARRSSWQDHWMPCTRREPRMCLARHLIAPGFATREQAALMPLPQTAPHGAGHGCSPTKAIALRLGAKDRPAS